MKSPECNSGTQPPGCKTSDGRLWFPTTKGIVVIDPHNLKSNELPPPVIIERAMIDKEPVDLGPRIEVPPGQRDFEFYYTGLSFLDPMKVRFKYRLEGYDRDWVEAGPRRIAYYTSLPPGRYWFRVKACNNDGVWNEAGAALEIELQPHFYQTDVFSALSAAALVLTGWGLYRFRVRQLVRRTEQLEGKVAERTAEVVEQKDKLAQANEQLQRVIEQLEQANAELIAVSKERGDFLAIAAHDLRPPLVNLTGYASEIRSAVEVIRAAMDKAWPLLDEHERRDVSTAIERELPEALTFIDSSASRMGRLIEAMMRLSRLGHRELRMEAVDMNAVVQAILKTLAYQIEQHGATVTVGPLPEAVADRNGMEIIMENLLSNAVKYLDPGRPGQVRISGERDHYDVTFRVQDNGRGIAPREMDKVFKIFGRAGKQDVPGEGMGLAYVQTLVRRHGGRIWCESQPGQGTTFSFTVPAPGASSDQER
jgi:signal transduction histidine kinase